MSTSKPFLLDIEAIRARAREHMDRGAITDGYSADRETVLKILNDALATEIICVLRYKRHYYLASGINAKSVAAEFLEHAKEEQEHADKIAKRIVQLDGKPDLSPDTLSGRSHADFGSAADLVEMLQEDLIAERIAIDTYREIAQYIGHDDPTTRRLIESILAQEEEHAEDIASLLEQLGKKGEPAAKPPLRAVANNDATKN